MKYEYYPATELTTEHYNRWCDLLLTRPDLDSPFFHPELTRRTAAIRDDIEIAVLSEADEPVGFFPFLRGSRGIAQSIPGRLSEYHGMICDADLVWSPDLLIKKCDLNAWYFDHLPITQTAFQDSIWQETDSPFMDLSNGFDEYRTEIKQKGSSLSQVERKRRKLEREMGPIEFQYHSTDTDAFLALKEWKTAQHQRTGVLEVMHFEWVDQLLQSLLLDPLPTFGGVFSVMFVADKPVAVHLGMRTATNLHIWFPAYDVSYEKYSPGLILLLDLAAAASDNGITRIDFGKGKERYKQNFKSGDSIIAEGAVDHRVIAGSMRRYWHHTKRLMRSSRFRNQLEFPINATRKLRQKIAFR